MPQRRQPDPAARWLSHALVGAAAGYAFKKAGANGVFLAVIVSALVHEAFDAPVAQLLSDTGL